MTSASYLLDTARALAPQWAFFLALGLMATAITWCSLLLFEKPKKWLRATICGGWAFVAVLAICSGAIR